MVQFQAREYSLGCQLHSPRPKHHSSPTVAMGTRTVSWEELSRHNTPDDLWIAIAGVAYDVTNWGDSHPGGKMVFERSAGRDVTEPFQAYHPDWVAGTMERFKVGVLETERRNPLPGATVAYIKLFKKIKEEGLLETDYSFYLWTGAWLACLFALAWGLVLSGQWVLGAVATALFWQQVGADRCSGSGDICEIVQQSHSPDSGAYPHAAPLHLKFRSCLRRRLPWAIVAHLSGRWERGTNACRAHTDSLIGASCVLASQCSPERTTDDPMPLRLVGTKPRER